MNRPWLFPAILLVLLGLGLLVLMSQAWHQARMDEQRRRNALSIRLQHEEVPVEERIDGLVAVLVERDLEEARRLQRLVPPPNDAALRQRVIHELVAWIRAEFDHDPLRPERVEFLSQFLETYGAADVIRPYQEAYATYMDEFHRQVKRFIGMAGTLQPYVGIPDDAGALDRIVQGYDHLVTVARGEGFDPWTDAEFRQAMTQTRELVWTYTAELLQWYERSLTVVDEADLPGRFQWIQKFNLQHPRYHHQLVKASRVLDLLAWESGADDAAAAGLLAQVANDVSGGAGQVAALILLFLMPLFVLTFALREVVIGPAPVDPSADTLEHVDPVDLDTEGVTLDPLYTTQGGTTAGHTTRFDSSASRTAVAAEFPEGIDDEVAVGRDVVIPPPLLDDETLDEDGLPRV